MAVVDKLYAEASQLSSEERSELAGRLVRGLEPDDDEVLAPDDWQRAWSEVLERRLREVRDGTVELVDGDAVFQAAAERIRSRPR